MTTASAASAAHAYERGLDRVQRHRDGVFYTPAAVAAGLVRVAARGLDLGPGRRPTVWDPAVGGGVFLLAAADLLADAGHDPRTIVEDLLWGSDIDAEAVAATRKALRTWATDRWLERGSLDGPGAGPDARHVVVADSLTTGRTAWSDAPLDGFDLVVGNPPFQSQLGRRTARSPARLTELRDRLGAVVTPYADSAALFLVEACRSVAPGGRVALVVPESVLAARDAGLARSAALERCDVAGFWWAGARLFDAVVDVCAPILVRADRAGRRNDRPSGRSIFRSIDRWSGPLVTPAAPVEVDTVALAAGGSWAVLLAPAAEPAFPVLARVDGTATLASIATATAGFRDQFYGIAADVHEADDADDGGDADGAGAEPGGWARLVTSGLIDPFRCRWGSAPARFAGRAWRAPVVDLVELGRRDPKLGRWGSDRLVPKIVLATQTRVLEPVVDLDGRWWPSVPTIAVVPSGEVRVDGEVDERGDLWAIAAVLAAPPVTAWALRQFRGSALARDAIKLSATQVLDIPLPPDAGAWAAGATAARRAQQAAERGDAEGWRAGLESLGSAMTEAYGAPRSVLDWWIPRLPRWR